MGTNQNTALTVDPRTYNPANDLTTYRAAHCPIKIGAITVDENGLATGVVYAKCNGARTWQIKGEDGKLHTVQYNTPGTRHQGMTLLAVEVAA